MDKSVLNKELKMESKIEELDNAIRILGMFFIPTIFAMILHIRNKNYLLRKTLNHLARIEHKTKDETLDIMFKIEREIGDL